MKLEALMKLLLYIYVFLTVTIPVCGVELNSFNRNALDLRKRLIDAKNSFKFKEPDFGKPEINAAESVFIIKDKRSSISGFYTSLWGVPAGITIASAIINMQKPVITDGKGNSYEIKSMLVLPGQDIVIFELNKPGALKPLPLAYNLASFPVNSPISAYGNDQGRGVIAKSDGVIRSIEQQKIEISPKLVPGNCGGPLLCRDNVIGVLTWPRRSVPARLNLEGTLFEGKTGYLEKYYGAPKSFAVRLDAIVPAKSEIFDPVSGAKDIKVLNELKDANNQALAYKIKIMEALLQGKSSEKLIRSAWALVHMKQDLRKPIEDCYSQLSFDPNQYTCSNKMSAKLFLEQLEIYRRNSCTWGFEELFTSQDPDFLKEFLPLVKKLKRHFQVPPKCRYCKGKGYRMVEIDNPEYARDKMKFAFNTVYLKCEYCNGTGKVPVSRYYYVLENKQAADKIFKPLKISFLGFTPGSDKSASRHETSRMLFVERIVSDISSTYIYNKSPRFSLANSVALNYVLGKLQEVKIFFPYNKELYQYMKTSLEKKYGKLSWETGDKSTFCGIDKPDYRITIGWTFRVSAKNKLETLLYVSCKHKELSQAKCAFERLKHTVGKIKGSTRKNKSEFGF